MGEAEYIVMGSWAVHAKTGKVRHRPCRRWCNLFNDDGYPTHICDAKDDEGKLSNSLAIPAMVVTVSECLRSKKQDASV